MEKIGTGIDYTTKWQGTSPRKKATVPLFGGLFNTSYCNYGCDALQYWSSCFPVDLVLQERLLLCRVFLCRLSYC